MALRLVILVVTGAVIAMHSASALAAPRTAEKPTMSASAFVDSIGINVHMSYNDTPYVNRAVISARLRRLGVRHIRDSIVPGRSDQHEAFAALARQGFRLTLIMGDPSGRTGRVSEVLPVLIALRRSVDAAEGANEYDASGPGWRGPLLSHQAEVYGAVKTAYPAIPILAPSLAAISSYSRLAAFGPVPADLGNLHFYPGGREPDGGLLPDRLAQAGTATPGRPVAVTEAGYHNGLGDHPGVSERAAGTYVPRLLLSNFRQGVPRTFLYELVDQAGDPADADLEGRFGLLRNDLSGKPAFHTTSRLIRLLDDGGGARRASSIAYRLGGDRSGLQDVMLRRCDGTSFLALWRAESVFDTSTGLDRHQPARSATVELPSHRGRVRVHRLEPRSRSVVLPAGPRLTLKVGTEVKLVEVPSPVSPRPAFGERTGSLRRTLEGLQREIAVRGAGCLAAPGAGRLALAGRAPGRYRIAVRADGRPIALGAARVRRGRPAAVRLIPRRRARTLRAGTRLRVGVKYQPVRGGATRVVVGQAKIGG